MSLIDDVVGKKIPTGKKFEPNVGPSSLKKKLYSATRSGSLQNLSDNQDVIMEIGEKRKKYIRSNSYTRDMMEADIREAEKSGNLTDDDRKDLRAVFENWKRGDVVDTKIDNKPKELSKSEKRVKEAKKRIKPVPEFGLPDFIRSRESISIKKNPWTSSSGGLGGSISSGANRGSTPKRPTLLK